MPGTTTTGPGPIASRTARTSSPETTTPAAPAPTASDARAAGDAAPFPAWLDSTVTPSTPGRSTPASAAPASAPCTAASTIWTPPGAWTVRSAAPSRPAFRAARPTVVGMSCSLRSRNTGTRLRIRITASGPAAVNSSRPTLANAIRPRRRRTSRSAWSRSETSAATISGFREMVMERHLSSEVRRTGESLPRHERGHPVRDADRGLGVEEVGRADLHRPRPRQHQLDRVGGRDHAPDAEDGHLRERPGHLEDAPDRHRADRRPRQPAGHGAQLRLERLGVDRHAEQRVDQREAVRAGADAGLGDLHDVR